MTKDHAINKKYFYAYIFLTQFFHICIPFVFDDITVRKNKDTSKRESVPLK